MGTLNYYCFQPGSKASQIAVKSNAEIELIKKEAIKKFYKDWFKTVGNLNYQKVVYKVEPFSDYVLGIGNFGINYSTAQHAENKYTGKYMIMWKRNEKMRLTILSVTFGSDKYIWPEEVPYAGVQVKEGFVYRQYRSRQLCKQHQGYIDNVSNFDPWNEQAYLFPFHC
jgi:hypothetical protein